MLRAEVKSLQLSNQNMQQLVEDLKTELKQYQLNLIVQNELKDLLSLELQKSAQQVADLEQKVYKSNKISLDLLADIKKLQLDVGFYYPVETDPIDVALGDYINVSADRSALKVLFVREGDGYYSFGSKKCYV